MDCNLVICQYTEAGQITEGKYEAYIVPFQGQGYNQIYTMELYANDYDECIDEEQYKDWLISCFDEEIEIYKTEDTTYTFKINIK